MRVSTFIILALTLQSRTNKGLYKESNNKVSRSANGVVATAHPLATQAAVNILAQGGNAMDAAVSAAFTLTVVEPTMNGIGGRTQILIYSPTSGDHGIDATTSAPDDYDYENAPKKKYGRPLVIAMSADLADSTNISGFAKGWDGQENHGFYDKISNLDSPLMPQGITEFTNAGMMAGLATVNFSEDTYKNFNGFYGAMSTYGSFSYLKYGPIRLFSQIAQDSDLKVGKLIWVAGHTGPETAEDSRTHFGIFAPGVTQLFPDGHIVNIHPWEHNEVAPVLAAAFNTDIPIIGLHLTRPPITIPDRKALGMAPHLDAAKGAYIIKDFVQDKPKEGVVIVRGTSSTNSVVELLPRIIEEGPNVKIVAAISWVLFQQQSETYRNAIIAPDEWHNAMIITNGGRRLMHKWMANRIVEDYSLSPDWDDRWRTGGSLDEIVDEAHLSPRWLWAGITKFAADRDRRLDMIRGGIPV